MTSPSVQAHNVHSNVHALCVCERRARKRYIILFTGKNLNHYRLPVYCTHTDYIRELP